ncbi:MAG: helicase-exonuclease AddAB subunit AddA [Dorea sp.]
MGVTWTKEQQKVIELRNRNILVSAAAGSGKTAVLVERIITMLTDEKNPIDVDHLLIVTFTEAAAAEMKERIRSAIEKKLVLDPDNEHLLQQATLIHNAQITTIHSFCLSVIRDHFHAIDIDPGFRIGEEGELKLLKHDVISEILEERYVEGKQEFLDFAVAYGGKRSDKNLEELILKIYEFSRSYPDANGWLESCVQAYEAETKEALEESLHIQLVMKNTKAYLEDAKNMLLQGLIISGETDGPAAYEVTLLKDLQVIENLFLEDTFAGLNEKMQNVSWVRLAINKDKTVSEEKVAVVKALREQVKEIVKTLKAQYFYQDIDGILEDIIMCRPAIKELKELVSDFAVRFEEKKRAQNMIDFSDMEQYALRILTDKTEDGFVPSSIAKEYQQHFEEIMIDEYQDSNMIQETILTSISKMSEQKYNIFMVGDVKQSIYRFRLSRPELFMEKFNTYSVTDGEKQRIDLHKNFRSRREVLDSTNYIFEQIMTRKLGGIVYDDQAALYVGADYKERDGFQTEVLAIDSNMDEWSVEGKDKISERELEARAIVRKIRTLMKIQEVTDKKTGEFRKLRYSDIVILTRSVKGFADVFTEVLNREGIPAYAGTREGYFSAQEIGVMLSYLRTLDNRQQDIPMAAVLASPIGDMTENEMALIRSEYQELSFHEAVLQYRESGGDPMIRKKLESCFGMMDWIREKVPYTPIHELLHYILEKTGYGDYVSAMPGGEQRRANLDMLVEKARAFESTSYKGLFHFVRYIEQLQKYDVDYGEASIEDEQSDTVRIMTIHKSKGLEFPVVFVAGMGKRFNMQDARSSVVLHAKLGIGLDAIDIESRMKSPSIIKKVIQKEEVLESLGEELRVLYVALTRAKEKLIITGTISNLEKKMIEAGSVRNQKEQELSFGLLSTASTYWDWILPALVRMKEEVPMTFSSIGVEEIVKEEVEEEVEGRLKKAVFEQWDTQRIYDETMKNVLEEQFAYQYPYGTEQSKKLKFTVSELKKRVHMLELLDENTQEMGEILYEEPEVVPLLPKFLQEEEELTGALRGTAYHRVMELLDFSKDYTGNELADCLKEFAVSGRITEEAVRCVRLKDLQRFLDSEAGKRMKISAKEERLWKEQPFVLGVDAREIYPDEVEGEMILVQGIIDVYFEEADGLVVLDYKTDQVCRAEELVEKYHAQLDYYAKALEQVLGKKVKEKIIYSFTLQKEIKLP